MSELMELREKQHKLVADARAKIEEITDDTSETRAREIEGEYDKIMEAHDDVEAKIGRRQKLEDAEARLEDPDPRRPRGENREVPGEGNDRGEIDVADVFERAMRHGVNILDTEERHALAETRKDLPPEVRAQAAGTDSAGGYTVPEGFQAEIVRSMTDFGPMLDPGVTRVLQTDSGNDLPWPTMDDTSNKGALLSENTQASEQDVTFGQKTLGAYTYTSKIVRVSLQLLQDSAFEMNGLLRDVFGERIGRIANEHLTTGSGSSQPNGIVTASTQGTTAAANNAITFEELFDLEHSVDPAYRRMPNVGWMFNDTTLKAIRKLKDNDGRFIWQPSDVRVGAPATLSGYPYSINQDMADIGANNKPIIFGAMNKYVTRIVRDFTMLRLVERYADYLQVGFIGFNRIDGELVDTAAVKHLVNPT